MSSGDAMALLRRVEVVRIASTTTDGEPMLRVVHPVIIGGFLAFHSADKGEKLEMIGREAVVSAEEIVCEVPSYFLDPQRACPATTYYLSVQVRGVIQRIDDNRLKAEVLQGLMKRFQPEGGHTPITHDDPLYRNAVRGLAVLGVSLDQLQGKSKLGQNKKPEVLAKVIEGLWRRGSWGDISAIEKILRANPKARPAWLRGPQDTILVVEPDDDDLEVAVRMLEGAYWNQGISAQTLRAAHKASNAWVVARKDGRLVATARAISDVHKRAWVYDVHVDAQFQRRGLGRAVMELLMDHPALREVHTVFLATKDAQPLYRQMGFVEAPTTQYTPMVKRACAPGATTS